MSWACRTHDRQIMYPASYRMDSRGYLPGIKRPWREDDHSPPTSAEV